MNLMATVYCSFLCLQPSTLPKRKRPKIVTLSAQATGGDLAPEHTGQATAAGQPLTLNCPGGQCISASGMSLWVEGAESAAAKLRGNATLQR